MAITQVLQMCAKFVAGAMLVLFALPSTVCDVHFKTDDGEGKERCRNANLVHLMIPDPCLFRVLSMRVID